MAISLRQKGLLPLAERFPGFAGFAPGKPRSRQVYEMLASASRSLRTTRAQPFYSMHDVAGFFGLAVSTVAGIFRKLERDGLLQCQRGAMTTVPPRRSRRPRARPQGIVATPIWSPGFVRFADLRRFFRTLEEALWQRRMVASNIFFGQEALQPTFVERLLQHEPDAVLWLTPGERDWQPIRSLRDAGLRVVVVADRDLFGQEKYHLSWCRALRQGLAAWQAQGIRSLVVPGWSEPGCSSTHAIHQVAHELGLTLRHVQARLANYAADAVQRLERLPDCGFVFDDDFRLAALCATQPQEMAALLSRRRCLVTRPLNLPSELLGDRRVDAVVMDWGEVAATLAAEIADGRAFIASQPVSFEADWQPGILASELNVRYGVE